jgi:GAF domain-containing protein
VLDVQSQQPAAFTEDDTSLLGVLADQVAIAIENARLFAGTRQALVEVQNVHRQYLEHEWSRWAAERGLPSMAYQYTPAGLEPAAAEQLPEAQVAWRAGEAVVVNRGPGANGTPSALAVPIKLRGQVIGVIDLQRAADSGGWSEEEIALVQSITDDLAQALENARLLEQTMRRAQREKAVAGITDRIYGATDARSILQIAAEELRRVTGSARAVVRLSREETPSA